MTDSTIGVAEPGNPTKLLQSYQNTVSSQTVQAEGVVQVDLNGVPVPRGTSADPLFVGGTGSDNTANSTAKLPVLAGRANTFAPTFADGNMVPLSLTTAGALRTSLIGTSSITANQGTPNTQVNAWPVTLTSTLADVRGLDATTGQTLIGAAAASVGESLYVLPVGTDGVSQHFLNTDVTGTLLTAEQTRLTANDKPDVTVNQSGTLKTSNVNIPLLSLDPQGSLQVNSDNLRRVEERIMMLAELAALNSLILSDNGPGGRNYQELR